MRPQTEPLIPASSFTLPPWLIAVTLGAAIVVLYFIYRTKRRKTKRGATPTAQTPQRSLWQDGLQRTQSQLGKLWSKLGSQTSQVSQEILADLEETLISADFGLKTTQSILHDVVAETAGELRTTVHDRCVQILTDSNFDLWSAIAAHPKPYVVLCVGVNGVGKTTTIGKLAHQARERGLKVMLGAGDTFRAAAGDQLKIWSERAGADVVSREGSADPASVLFDAVSAAKARGHDLVILDTAGRLHNKKGLMDELGKCVRVMQKVIVDAPHQTWLVVDATTGQNAVHQAKEFNDCLKLSGLILTKLDGTAKGGIVVAIAQELNVPVRFVGLGEKLTDLVPFQAEKFVDSILPLDPPQPSR
jgi:fused signal recognition particle receptor